MTNIFVGNLDITVTAQQLREAFTAHGAVETVTIVEDRDTGEPRGIAFVEMTHATEAQAALSALDGKMLNERPMSVNEARPKLHRDRHAILGPEITGDIVCEPRTGQAIVRLFLGSSEMDCL